MNSRWTVGRGAPTVRRRPEANVPFWRGPRYSALVSGRPKRDDHHPLECSRVARMATSRRCCPGPNALAVPAGPPVPACRSADKKTQMTKTGGNECAGYDSWSSVQTIFVCISPDTLVEPSADACSLLTSCIGNSGCQRRTTLAGPEQTPLLRRGPGSRH